MAPKMLSNVRNSSVPGLKLLGWAGGRLDINSSWKVTKKRPAVIYRHNNHQLNQTGSPTFLPICIAAAHNRRESLTSSSSSAIDAGNVRQNARLSPVWVSLTAQLTDAAPGTASFTAVAQR